MSQEANMHENRFNEYRIPSGMLIVFLEKALTLIHMETHLDDEESIKECKQPYTLLSPHTCDVTVEQTQRQSHDSGPMRGMIVDEKQYASGPAASANASNVPRDQLQNFNQGQVSHAMAPFESQMAAQRGLMADGGLNVGGGQPESLMHHSLAMVQGQNPFEQNNLQQQTQQAAILQRQMAHHYQQQASQQFGMPHNGFQDPFIGAQDNQLQAFLQQQQRQPQQSNQATQALGTASNAQPGQQLPQHKMPSMMGQLGTDPSQQAHFLQQQQNQHMNRMMAAQIQLMQGLHSGEVATQDQKIEPLEHNADLGVYLRQTSQDSDCMKEIYFTQFNPKHRLLATAGNGFIAHLWDLRKDDYSDFKKKEIPHVRDQDEHDNQDTAVSSLHWNNAGDKLLTSSSDYVARVWRVNSEGGVEIEKAKEFNECLMQSKFCDEADHLVATGGLMSQIYVWDCSHPDCREVACFDHSNIDPEFKGMEIEWQNANHVAVAGKSQFIYLWSIERPSAPLVKWVGHQKLVEQIQWDPHKKLLASCSDDQCVHIWSPEKSVPELTLNKSGESAVLTIKWSNNCGGEDSMLACGCADGQVRIFNVKTGYLQMKLDTHDRELGLRVMSFSPQNQMLATGGVDNLIIWALAGQGSILKHFKRQSGSQQPGQMSNYGMVGIAPGSGQSGNPIEEQQWSQNMVQELTWSPDTMLLGAAIHDYVAIFDMGKIVPRAFQTGVAGAAHGTSIGQL